MTVAGEEEAKKAERDEKALPQVLVIGDDVYNEPTRTAAGLLRGRVQLVYGKNAIYNSTAALENFDKLLNGKQWDLIHFNFGFNDLMHKDPATQAIRAMHKDVGGVRVTSPQQYEKNLRELVKRFKAHGAKVIWASTTPIVGSDGILMEGSEVVYNEIAAKVMQEHNVTINDMHAHAAEIHKTAKHKNTYSYKGYPLYPPMMRSILKELNLMRPVKGSVKVFVMVGGWTHIGGGIVVDSNKPRPGQNRGTLDDLVLNEKTAATHAHLLDKDGNWTTRPDVWIQFDRRGLKAGTLGIGYGGDRKHGIGSELALGHLLGDHFDQQVYIIKTALGTPSLAQDLRPPGSGATGKSYTMLLQQIKDSLANLQNNFPDYTDESGYEVAGLVLNLGEQDTNADLYADYLPMLITDLRKELNDANVPVIIVGTGIGGRKESAFPEIINAQQSVAALPQFKATVSYVETRDFWPSENEREAFRYPSYDRWYDNAESFYEMGEAVGEAMLKLLN